MNLKLEAHLTPTRLPKPMDGLTHVYYINLDRSSERRGAMQSLFRDPYFEGVHVERVAGCDGRSDSLDTVLRFVAPCARNPRISDIEYACTVSHFRAIQQVASIVDTDDLDDDAYALIVEDDLSLEFVPYWTQTIQERVAGAPSDWEVLQLSYIPVMDAIDASIKYNVWQPLQYMCGAAAYLIRRTAARRLMRQVARPEGVFELSGPVLADLPHQADWLLYSVLRTYTVNPPMFTYRDINDSHIHPEHVVHQAESKEKTKRVYLASSLPLKNCSLKN